MKLRDLIEEEDIAYHCDTLEKAERFIKWLVDNGYYININSQEVVNYWKWFKEKTCFVVYQYKTKKYIDYFAKSSVYNFKVYEFDDLDEFKEEKNNKKLELPELDSISTFNATLVPITENSTVFMQKEELEKVKNSLYVNKGFFENFYKENHEPKNMLIVNNVKKYVLLKFDGEESKIVCNEEDKFNWKIGFGLAISHIFSKHSYNMKRAREYYRNSKGVLDYKKYAHWCILYFVEFSMDTLSIIENNVKEIKEYGKVDL